MIPDITEVKDTEVCAYCASLTLNVGGGFKLRPTDKDSLGFRKDGKK